MFRTHVLALFVSVGLVACVTEKSRDRDSHMLGTVVVPSDPGPPPTAVKPAPRPTVSAKADPLPATPLVLYDASTGKQDAAWAGAYAFTYKPEAGPSVRYEVRVTDEKSTMGVYVRTAEGAFLAQGRSASKEVFDVYFDGCESNGTWSCAGMLRGSIAFSLTRRGGKTMISFGALAGPNASVRELAADPPAKDAGAGK